MQEDKTRFARKKYFVSKRLQIRFSLSIFITTVVIGLITVWTTYVTTWQETSAQLTSQQFHEKIDAVYEETKDPTKTSELISDLIVIEFSNIFDQVSAVLVLRLLAGSFLLFLLSIFVSHKIAGPLWRIEKTIRSVSKGDLSVNMNSLRFGDELNELAGALNEAIVKLRNAIEKMFSLTQKITQGINKIVAAKNQGNIDSNETKKVVDELQLIAGELVTEINQFKTEP
ncbi:MAG: methyl-accepting chemotaxis protein [Candidatus Omnitrophota bacterium]